MSDKPTQLNGVQRAYKAGDGWWINADTGERVFFESKAQARRRNHPPAKFGGVVSDHSDPFVDD